MGKRGHENAQLSKEAYEALENAGSSSDGVPQEGFARAPAEEELSERPILRARMYVHKEFFVPSQC